MAYSRSAPVIFFAPNVAAAPTSKVGAERFSQRKFPRLLKPSGVHAQTPQQACGTNPTLPFLSINTDLPRLCQQDHVPTHDEASLQVVTNSFSVSALVYESRGKSKCTGILAAPPEIFPFAP